MCVYKNSYVCAGKEVATCDWSLILFYGIFLWKNILILSTIGKYFVAYNN